MSNQDTEKRMKKAIQEAEQAFWLSVAQSYPEAKSGDLDPGMFILENKMKEAVEAWVDVNIPA